MGVQEFLVEIRVPGIGIRVFKVGILLWKTTIPGHNSEVQGQKPAIHCAIRILGSVIGPTESVARASRLMNETLAGKVRMLTFLAGLMLKVRILRLKVRTVPWCS